MYTYIKLPFDKITNNNVDDKQVLSDTEKDIVLSKHPGHQYVSKPVGELNFGKHHCFLLSVYSSTFATYFRNFHNGKRVNLLPDILIQILLGKYYESFHQLAIDTIDTGTSYLHQINIAHNNLAVNSKFT
jgi:hypothetical protein